MKQSNPLGCFSLSAIITALITLAVIVGTTMTRGNSMFSPGALNAVEGAAIGGVSSHAAMLGDCAACHVAPWSTERMADRCVECHTALAPDMSKIAKAHGEMDHDNPNLGCRHCHPEHRGPSALLTLESARADFPHDVMDYSLSGHALTASDQPFVCEDCHAESLMGFDSATCIECHRNLDLAFTQAHALSWGEDCLACHDGVDTYNKHFDHGKVPFALTGAHVEVDCYSCHTDARALVDLQSAPRDCLSCHRDDEPHELRFGSDCAECHTMDAWTPALFDHNLAAFKLDGKHVDVDCEECHTLDAQLKPVMECEDCHAEDDEHDGRFTLYCGACHTTTGWADSPFDHNLSSFPLSGGHAKLVCKECHTKAEEGQFTGASGSCLDCHGYPRWHGEAFGANCVECHTVNNWRATYSGAHSWQHPREEGEVDMSDCRGCHPVSVYQSDCNSCHEGGGEN